MRLRGNMNESFTQAHRFAALLAALTTQALAAGLSDSGTRDPFAVLDATSPFPLVASLIDNFWEGTAACHAERTGEWPTAH
jgi:hypothetical protein